MINKSQAGGGDIILPCPHEGMILSVERGQVSEDIVIRANTFLSLHSVRAVIPGIVDHDAAIMETQAEDKGMVQHPVHHRLHLLLSPLGQLGPWLVQVSPAREASVEILVVDVVPRLQSFAVRVDRGKEVNVRVVYQAPDPRICLIILSEVSGNISTSHYLAV